MGIIEVNNLSFTYLGHKNNKPLFENLNLSVKEGDFISILGPSGCGKSTLLDLLSGFKNPDTGEVYFKGNIVNNPFKEGQMIFQDTGQLLPWLTVEKNILFPEFRFSLFKKKIKVDKKVNEYLDDLLEKTGLSSFRNYYPNQLSGGLKQRVSLVRAIFANPQILFMDEPFVSLDAPARFELQKLLINLWKSTNKTILFVTHDISEALLLSDKILIFSGDTNSLELIDNNLKRPRNRDDQKFIQEKLNIYSMIDSL